MKKKILVSICTLFAVCTMFVGMNKVNGQMMIPPTIPAKAPQTTPDENSILYAVLDEEFNFGEHIDFSGVKAKSDMRKIILTTSPGTQADPLSNEDAWFTVYCLDGSLKFPQYSIVNGTIPTISSNRAIQAILMMSLFNNEKLYDVLSTAKKDGYIFEPTIVYETDGKTDDELLADFNAGNQITVNVRSITYTAEGKDPIVINASSFPDNAGSETYSVTVKKDDVLFDKYTAKKMSGEDYGHALWILEHSYPTFGLKESLEMAGADYAETIAELTLLVNPSIGKTKNEIKEQFNSLTTCNAADVASKFSITEAEATSAFCEQKTKEMIETSKLDDYVYSTVQYAVWRANGGVATGGDKIGDKLNGSVQLDILYQYLIKNRPEYKNYLNFKFDNSLKLNRPTKEIYKETDTHYIYGPFTVGYNMISIKEVTVSIEGASDGVSLVDEAGNSITSIKPEQKFFVKAEKAKKITNLKINVKAEDALTFVNEDDRGRIYYSYYPMSQNVVSGGIYATIDKEMSLDLVFNPKTGDSNVAVVFVIGLIAFSIGFVAIIMKKETIELN